MLRSIQFKLAAAAVAIAFAGPALADASQPLQMRYEGASVIHDFNVDQPRSYGPGERVFFTARGEPGAKASASISTSRGSRDVNLSETSPGIYEGFYTVQDRDDFSRPAFSAKIDKRGKVGQAWARPGDRFEGEARPIVSRPAYVCESCGVVSDIRQVYENAQQSNAPGMIIGGLVGGVLGNQVGGGRGRNVTTVLGALAGGAAGNEIGRNNSRQESWLITVQLDSGATQTFRNSQRPNVSEGQRVRVENDQLVLDDGRR